MLLKNLKARETGAHNHNDATVMMHHLANALWDWVEELFHLHDYDDMKNLSFPQEIKAAMLRMPLSHAPWSTDEHLYTAEQKLRMLKERIEQGMKNWEPDTPPEILKEVVVNIKKVCTFGQEKEREAAAAAYARAIRLHDTLIVNAILQTGLLFQPIMYNDDRDSSLFSSSSSAFQDGECTRWLHMALDVMEVRIKYSWGHPNCLSSAYGTAFSSRIELAQKANANLMFPSRGHTPLERIDILLEEYQRKRRYDPNDPFVSAMLDARQKLVNFLSL